MNTVGLVEENPDNRLRVRMILEDHYQINEYAARQIALDGFRANRPVLLNSCGLSWTQPRPEVVSPQALPQLLLQDWIYLGLALTIGGWRQPSAHNGFARRSGVDRIPYGARK